MSEVMTEKEKNQNKQQKNRGWKLTPKGKFNLSVCVCPYLCELLFSQLYSVKLLFKLTDRSITLGTVKQRLL